MSVGCTFEYIFEGIESLSNILSNVGAMICLVDVSVGS